MSSAGQPQTTYGSGHGTWPYILPYVSFLLAIEFSLRMPAWTQGAMLFIKPAIPLLLMVWFASRGAYAELRQSRLSLKTPLDISLGVLLAILWMAPFVLIPSLGPKDAEPFNPDLLGPSSREWALGIRMFGYAVVTPFFEELFIRSFVMRYAEVWSERGDFRSVPLAHYSLTSFVATIVVFTLGHVPWEWWVAIPWVALTNLWFYWRKDLLSVIVVHGVTNATILLIAIFGEGWFEGADGPLSLWFFV